MKFSRVRVGLWNHLFECQDCHALMRMECTQEHYGWHVALAKDIRRASMDRVVKRYV